MTDKLRAAAEAALEALSFGQHTLKQVGEDHWESRGELAMSALRAALAEQEAEPVAWGMRHSDGRIYDCIAPGEHDREPGQYNVPLYTAPPRREWQGLTDEEIAKLIPNTDAWNYEIGLEEAGDFARAIEAALKEKNT